MRENRKSGSEGGAGLIPRPDPYPAPTIHHSKRAFHRVGFPDQVDFEVFGRGAFDWEDHGGIDVKQRFLIPKREINPNCGVNSPLQTGMKISAQRIV